MRIIAEIIGIILILIGAYYGGRDIWDRWSHGPKKELPKPTRRRAKKEI